jgi:hypothetical protein
MVDLSARYLLRFESSITFRAMSPRGSKTGPSFTKIEPRASPDDVLYRIQERDRLAAADTRTEAERWLGDPPPGRSALAQRNSTPPEMVVDTDTEDVLRD